MVGNHKAWGPHGCAALSAQSAGAHNQSLLTVIAAMTSVTVHPSGLRLQVDAQALGFADTSELVDLPLPWIGQERAEAAARFGLHMTQADYNLFVLGEVGSGRTSLMRQLMQSEAATRAVPPDLCYLYNHDVPERPLALRLPAGEGRELRTLMAQLAKTLEQEIPKRLAAQDCRSACERVERAHKVWEDGAFADLRAFAEQRQFGLLREQGRLVFTLHDKKGQPVTESKAMAMDAQARSQVEAAEAELQAEISRFLQATRSRELALSQALQAARREHIEPLLDQELHTIRKALRKHIKDTVKLSTYLDQVRSDLLENLPLFSPGDAEDGEAQRLEALLEVLSRLRVNVAVDNHGCNGAPVVVEDNPLFRNLFGAIEYESDGANLLSDFSRIRAGSLLKAHGGFLLLHLRDLLADEPVWEKLRRFLRSARLQIEEPGMLYAPIAAVSLTPEAVDVDVKIVLIASVEEYYAVQEGDPEFARRFRCKVDFADSFMASDESRRTTAIFVAHTCQRLGLLHLSADAVAAVIEETHRAAADQQRQSALFAPFEALVIESAALARQRGAALVQASDVQAALAAHKHRHDYPAQRLMETLVDGERLLEVRGQAVGRINGLTVLDLGDYQFGFPVRVTARTHAGDEGLLNIEREVEMSGPIHDKGVLILHSYLSALFAHLAPLALNASVVFEQEYHGVEGDSASCAEFFALLSCLSGLSLRQGLAVTGALNQHGEVLPVGGVNEKIEGYFDCCEQLGLDGEQGVILPRRNLRHLMLSPRVVQAVAQNRFHIHAVDSAAEGMALLCGQAFGELGPGGYPTGTVLGSAQATLQAYRRACQAVDAPKAQRRHRLSS
jgi:predicted ATP-dependent protease